MSRDEPPSDPKPVAATAPGEAGLSMRALMDAFGEKLPWWLRKMGVRDQEIEDATQEVFVEILNELETIPRDLTSAQGELIRLTSRVACRRKRDAQRNGRHVSDVETSEQINREEWIATRMLWAEAFHVLDERAKKLFIAHDIEGHSYASIAAEWGEKEDTLEKRGAKLKEQLRTEILRLLGKKPKRNGSSNDCMAFVFGLGAFDRALFRTMFEMEEQYSAAPPMPKVRPSVSIGSMLGGLPMALLVGAILMVPVGSPKTSTLWAAKIGNNLRLPDIVVQQVSPTQSTTSTPAIAPVLPGKTKTAQSPVLDKATRASLMRVATQSGR